MGRDTVKEQVRGILIDYPQARDNDLVLIFIYLRDEMGLDMPELSTKHLNNSSICESVRRERQKIQNKEKVLLPASPHIRQKRRIAEEDWRNWSIYSKLPDEREVQ